MTEQKKRFEFEPFDMKGLSSPEVLAMVSQSERREATKRREIRNLKRKEVKELELTIEEALARVREINADIQHQPGEQVLITLRIPCEWRDLIDALVSVGLTPKRSEYIRQAIKKELWSDADIMGAWSKRIGGEKLSQLVEEILGLDKP